MATVIEMCGSCKKSIAVKRFVGGGNPMPMCATCFDRHVEAIAEAVVLDAIAKEPIQAL